MPLALYALTESMEPAFRDWQKAWGKEPIVPSGCFLEDGEPFEAWLSKRRALEDPVFAASRGWSPGKDFCLMESPAGPILVMSNLRTVLTPSLLEFGGHIAYGTRPEWRRRGLAAQCLSLTLEKAKEAGLRHVLITCSRENLASARTILKCGGTLDDEVPRPGGGVTQRYWISLYDTAVSFFK